MDVDKQLHSTPKSDTKSSGGGGKGSKKKALKPDSKGDGDEEGSLSYSLDETGDSTRSLLSVLSHSSIEDLSKDRSNSSESGSETTESNTRYGFTIELMKYWGTSFQGG